MTRLVQAAPLVFAVAILAGCGSTAGADAPAPTAPPGGAVIAARGVAFDRAELRVPADRPFELVFANQEGVPHNVSVMDAAGRATFTGEIFSGVSTRSYQVPAIPAGSYRFQCDVHPDMAGTLVAIESEPTPAPAPGNPGS